MPTYLDQHICLAKEKETFEPGKRWEDAAQCKVHFENVRQSVIDKSGPPLQDNNFYVMQNVPAPPCGEACKLMCAGFGDKAEMTLNNQLRYVRIGNKQLKFTGDAAGFQATQPGCMYKCTSCPCFLFHNFAGTYNTAFNQYIDNHLEWLSEEESAAKNAESSPSAASSMFSMGGAAKVAPEPNPDTTPSQQPS
jgi:hypothetical protein